MRLEVQVAKKLDAFFSELKVSLPSSKQPTSVPSADSTVNIHTISANLSNNHFKFIAHVCSDLQVPFRLTSSDQQPLRKTQRPSLVLQIHFHSRSVTCLKDITETMTRVSAKFEGSGCVQQEVSSLVTKENLKHEDIPATGFTKLNNLWHILTYLLTSWSRALLEKLTDFELVKNFPAF